MEIKDVLKNIEVERVVISYDRWCYDEICITCDLYHNLKNVSVVSAVDISLEGSIDKAYKLFFKILDLSKKCQIHIPSSEKQIYDGSYYREIVFDNLELEFKKRKDKFVITNLLKKTSNGFCVIDEPYPVPPTFKFIKNIEGGKSMYEWNSLGPLFGLVGMAIVSDGMVIESKTIAVA